MTHEKPVLGIPLHPRGNLSNNGLNNLPCDHCGKMVDIATPSGPKIVCRECLAEHELEERDKKG
jgi:hypothetical protein